ncbi:MAG: F0F1 ATP synthase subunit B [Patescibacteria group bacterium]
MEEIINTFHIEWELMLGQIINFAIVASVLWFFAVKPLMKIMKDRTETIEKSLRNAEKIEVNLKETEEIQKQEITKAKKEAQEIIEKANLVAENSKQDFVKKAEEQILDLKNKAKQQVAEAKQEMLKEIKTEVADLVVLTVKKLIDKDLSSSEQKELINKTIKEVK